MNNSHYLVLAESPPEPELPIEVQAEYHPQIDLSWFKLVVFPGMLGGLTKTTLDFITPTSTEIATTAIAEQVMPSSPPPNLFILMSANIFLGAISAMIGTFVLSDLVDFQKSVRKIFGFSLIFGLSFSLVFDAATSKFSLETELNSLEMEKIQLQDMVLTSVINDKPSQIDQVMLIQSLRQLADQSENLYVQEKAIQSMAVVANRTQDRDLKIASLKCLARVANNSDDQTIQTDVVLAMEAIAIKSNQAALKQRSIEELELIKQNLEPEVMATLEQAIKHLKS